ncbi:MAG: hypothetical protein ACK5KT_05995 [Dysgonomonas sp.]
MAKFYIVLCIILNVSCIILGQGISVEIRNDKEFRSYRESTGMGGDYRVFSKTKLTPVNPEIIRVTRNQIS